MARNFTSLRPRMCNILAFLACVSPRIFGRHHLSHTAGRCRIAPKESCYPGHTVRSSFSCLQASRKESGRINTQSQDASEPNHLSHSSAIAHTAPDCVNEAVLGKQMDSLTLQWYAPQLPRKNRAVRECNDHGFLAR
jgi:hypothetical protein